MKAPNSVSNFLDICRIEKNLSPRTLKAYKCDFSELCEFLKPAPIEDATPSVLRSFIDYLESRQRQDSTIRRKIASIKSFFSYLENEKIVVRSPMSNLAKKFSYARLLPRTMSLEEIRRLLANCYKLQPRNNMNQKKLLKLLRDRVILEILFSTGIRIDELVRLNLRDIDRDQWTFLIFGKGKKERLLFISSQEVISAINAYLQIRELISIDPDAFLINKYGRRLSVHSIGKIFREYCPAFNGSRKFTPHALRHTMATMLIENGADVRSVQEILGHSRISTTEIYLHVSKKRKQEVLNKFNARNRISMAKVC